MVGFDAGLKLRDGRLSSTAIVPVPCSRPDDGTTGR